MVINYLIMNERELNKKEFIETSNDLLSSNLEIEVEFMLILEKKTKS